MEDGTYMSESSGEVLIKYLKDDLGYVDTFTFSALKNVLMQIEEYLRETESWDSLIAELQTLKSKRVGECSPGYTYMDLALTL